MQWSRFRCSSTKFFHVSCNLWTTFPYSATLINIQNVLIAFSLQLNPVNTVTNGPKKLAVLTGDRINEVFFPRKCMTVLPGGRKKMAVITRRTYYRDGYKAGFHCTQNSSTLSKIERTEIVKLCQRERDHHSLTWITLSNPIPPAGIEPTTFQVPVGRSNHWAMRNSYGVTVRKLDCSTGLRISGVDWTLI